jgi:hypothetical protein
MPPIKSKRVVLKPTFEELAIEIFANFGKPMHYRNVTDLVRKRRPMGGQTPYMTGYSVLHRSAAFENLGAGMFSLRKKPSAR